ncbi:MAG: glycosyltransferase [Pedobacter sp.]
MIYIKIGIFHWNSDKKIGGGEVLAAEIGKALGEPVYSVVSGKNPLGFVDISDRLSPMVKTVRGIRSLDYLTWSSFDPSDVGDFDLILTLGSTTRAMIVPEGVPMVNICFSTPRWLYDIYHYRKDKFGSLKDLIVPVAEVLRTWDQAVDKRCDYYISISPVIQRRLWKYMKRESDILYPPIYCSKYQNKSSAGYFLFLSRLEMEKRPEEAIQACINANVELVVAGVGSMEKKLRKKYGNYENIRFTGYVTESRKIDLLARCNGLIFPALAEDFGIVPIEALASGKPVICSGGFPKILISDKYGIDTDGTTSGIENAIIQLSTKEYDPDELMACAKQFDFPMFKKRLVDLLEMYKQEFDTKFNGCCIAAKGGK